MDARTTGQEGPTALSSNMGQGRMPR